MVGKKSFWLNHRAAQVGVVLALLVLIAYGRTLTNDFVNYDDPHYILENPMVRGGLTGESLSWAFTSFYASNWHPLTWISHMLDVDFFGLWAGGHHLVNLLLHAASSILLFLVLRRMTGALWSSAFVAALFALHPLHVESVVWAAERKDVLSAFFWMLTIWVYVSYTKKRTGAKMAMVSAVFAAGLMAKPMLVTLPFVLLLLDYWPLGRAGAPFVSGDTAGDGEKWRSLIREKLPLLILVVLSCLVTVLAQKSGGAMKGFDQYPLGFRAANALNAYTGYLIKMVVPTHLAVFYPYPVHIILWKTVLSAALLAGVTAGSLFMIRRAPYLMVGWLWYLGTLAPVIGLVQVGGQAMADRYTYLPLIGPFIMIAWGIPDLVKRYDFAPRVLAVAALAVVLVCAGLTYRQAGTWKDGYTLFAHAAEVVPGNHLAEYNLGNYWERKGDFNRAMDHYAKAIEARPEYWRPYVNYGAILVRRGELDRAEEYFQKAVALKPASGGVYINLGLIRLRQNRVGEAIDLLTRAVELSPRDPMAHANLGTALWQAGRGEEAVAHFKKQVELSPGDANAFNNLGNALWALKRPEEAVQYYSKALQINPRHSEARRNLAGVRQALGR